MDRKDEFSKWMHTVEEALAGNMPGGVEEDASCMNECGCGQWDCPECFPDQEVIEPEMDGIEIEMEPEGETCPTCGHAHGPEGHDDFDGYDEVELPMVGEEEEEFETAGKSSRPRSEHGGVTLGHIVQKTEFRKVGQDSPMTYGEDNLDEAPDELLMPDEEPRPKKSTKFSDPDEYDFDDILSPKIDQPLANIDEPGMDQDPEAGVPAAPMDLPVASRGDTQRRVGNITPSDTMRDFMNRINPDAGAGEPELEPTPQNELMIRTARDVPAVISTAMRAAGVQSPEWHTVNNLPGFANKNIRGMGRNLFSMFTSTPLGQIKTIANVNGQGPNTDEEVRAVAGWLMNNAEDLGDIELDHTMAIPGYAPDVKEYKANGIRFHVVRDPMGQYIYAYPDADARLQGPGQGQQQIRGRNDMPRLRESLFKTLAADDEFRYDLKEALRHDFAKLRENAELDETMSADERKAKRKAAIQGRKPTKTVSRTIGGRLGGQALLQHLHRIHKLADEAEMTPMPFDKNGAWKVFRTNPDNFIIVSGQNGCAAIKPPKAFIERKTKEYKAKGKTYNPATDNTVPFTVIAYKNDGEQIDPQVFIRGDVPPGFAAGDKSEVKTRLGLVNLSDPNDNALSKLNAEIGPLTTMWSSGWSGYRNDSKDDTDGEVYSKGSVKNDLRAARAKAGAGVPNDYTTPVDRDIPYDMRKDAEGNVIPKKGGPSEYKREPQPGVAGGQGHSLAMKNPEDTKEALALISKMLIGQTKVNSMFKRSVDTLLGDYMYERNQKQNAGDETGAEAITKKIKAVRSLLVGMDHSDPEARGTALRSVIQNAIAASAEVGYPAGPEYDDAVKRLASGGPVAWKNFLDSMMFILPDMASKGRLA